MTASTKPVNGGWARGRSRGLGPGVCLFLLGFLTLFLELVLIRFLAGNVWNLGYFPNLVLLAVFVGMGFGFLLHAGVPPEVSRRLFGGAAVVLAALVLFVDVEHPVVPGFGHNQGNVGGELYFTDQVSVATKASYGLFVVWFAGVALVFGLISQRTAKLFREFPPLTSYTLDIAGSIAGILAFMGVSALGLPAYLWFAIFLPPFVLAAGSTTLRFRLLLAMPLAAAAAFAWHADGRLMSQPDYRGEFIVRWSPYQKIENVRTDLGWTVFVNGIGHQRMLALEKIRESFYQVPHDVRRDGRGLSPYREVLVIGAGAGNDVAAALDNGATHVDAVEIDPGIAELGRLHHPARPYDDPRVTLTIDDGRAFITRTERRYDLVIFALTDSLVRVSSLAQLRLENYLFTVESIRRASGLLKPGGDIVFYNSYRRGWLVAKLLQMIREATGRYPRPIFRAADFVMLMAGEGARAEPTFSADQMRIDLPTDDWPFLYLRGRGIPSLYLGAIGGMATVIVGLVALLHMRQRREGGKMGGLDALFTKLAFLFMGTAFLLLETKSVVQFSLLFGTTWLNNSLVFLGILALVLAANHAAARVSNPEAAQRIAYVLLIASCLATLAYPLGRLLGVESPLWRFLAAGLMTFSPIFFANLIFSLSFRAQAYPEHLFGWNLVGATLGGLLEYTSMKAGYNALALVVAVCYTLVIACLALSRRTRTAATTLSPPFPRGG